MRGHSRASAFFHLQTVENVPERGYQDSEFPTKGKAHFHFLDNS